MPGAETFRASADAYERHVGRYGSQLASALIDFAGIEPGMRALDVGCGPGALTAALAERLGTANVSGVDPSEPFAEACGARLPGVEVAVAAAESLPFGDGAFDASLSQLVVNFMGDAEAGVREMARVTRPGGVVASCVWDYAGEMTLLRAFWDAAREVDPDRGAAADEGIVMRWCGDGELAELWSTAGLRDVRFGPLVVHASYADFEDLWSPLPSGVAPSGAFCKSLDSDGQAALHDAYRRRLAVGDGAFELSARAWAVAGTVPSGMARGNADLVRPIYEQWGRGNWVPRFEVYHPHMQWGWSDEFPGLDGVYEDHADPNPRLRAWLSEWEHWRAEAEDYLEIGNHVVVLATYYGRGRGSGVEIQQHGAHVFELRDGKVVRLEIFASREKAMESVRSGSGTPRSA